MPPRALTETFDGAFAAPGVVTAAACIDGTGTAIAVSPAGTPADGRFEIGSITKTMTAALLALLEAEGRLRLDDEVGRWLSAGANGGITLRTRSSRFRSLSSCTADVVQVPLHFSSPAAGHSVPATSHKVHSSSNIPVIGDRQEQVMPRPRESGRYRPVAVV